VQIVGYGSAKTFNCHADAFETITGARTGVFPVTYEPVDCDMPNGQGPTATVLDGMNSWYTKVIFSNLPQGVSAATLKIDGKAYAMQRSSGATWFASPGGSVGAASFEVALEGGGSVVIEDCFASWPVETGASCTGQVADRSAAVDETMPAPTPTTPEEPKSCFSAGDGVYLRAHTGKRLTAQGEAVHAKWDHKGVWQRWTLEKDSVGEVQFGDSVYLKGHTGMHLTVQGDAVHAKWDQRGKWQRLVLESAEGEGGRVCDGDAVSFRAHTGKRLTVQGEGVHAKWDHRGSWQRFVIEAAPAAALAQATE